MNALTFLSVRMLIGWLPTRCSELRWLFFLCWRSLMCAPELWKLHVYLIWFEARPEHTCFPETLNLCCRRPGPHALATDDWIELCTWFRDRRLAEPIRFYSGFWTGELRCSFLQWQEHPCVPGGWRVGDGGGERQREERERDHVQSEVGKSWAMRPSLRGLLEMLLEALLLGSLGPRCLPGGLAVLPALSVCGILLMELT